MILARLMTAKKKQAKKHCWKNVFYLLKIAIFFENRQQSNARAGQKKTHDFCAA